MAIFTVPAFFLFGLIAAKVAAAYKTGKVEGHTDASNIAEEVLSQNGVDRNTVKDIMKAMDAEMEGKKFSLNSFLSALKKAFEKFMESADDKLSDIPGFVEDLASDTKAFFVKGLRSLADKCEGKETEDKDSHASSKGSDLSFKGDPPEDSSEEG
jgi:hypothetical protein